MSESKYISTITLPVRGEERSFGFKAKHANVPGAGVVDFGNWIAHDEEILEKLKTEKNKDKRGELVVSLKLPAFLQRYPKGAKSSIFDEISEVEAAEYQVQESKFELKTKVETLEAKVADLTAKLKKYEDDCDCKEKEQAEAEIVESIVEPEKEEES